MSHIATKKQEELFNEAVKALKKCQKAGLVLIAKQDQLTAYTRQAEAYVIDNNCMSGGGSGGAIPYLYGRCINDSGADDYPNYLTEEDERKFNPQTFNNED